MKSLIKTVCFALVIAGCSGPQSKTPTNEPAGAAVAVPEGDPRTTDRAYGKFVRHELVTTQPAQAAKLYGELVGWTVTAIGEPADNRFRIDNGGREIAQIRPVAADERIPEGWMSWISVADIDQLMRDVPANGGTVLIPPYKSGSDTLAVLQGPTGGTFGVIQLGGKAAPAGLAKPGDFVLAQLWTDDFEAARNFYLVIGDYKPVEVNFGKTTYNIFRGEHDAARALLRLSPAGRESRWIPFVLAADVDLTKDNAKSLGATMITDPRDIPTLGRVTVFELGPDAIIGFISPTGWDPKSGIDW